MSTEIELKYAAALRREQDLEAALEAERERCRALADAIAGYLADVTAAPHTLEAALRRTQASPYAERGKALAALWRALDALKRDERLSIEALAALQVVQHGGTL
jgi:hypothetical protein